MSTANSLLHMWIMTTYPDIVLSYEKFDDDQPFKPIQLDCAVPSLLVDKEANKLTAMATYKTSYTDSNGKMITILFGLGFGFGYGYGYGFGLGLGLDFGFGFGFGFGVGYSVDVGVGLRFDSDTERNYYYDPCYNNCYPSIDYQIVTSSRASDQYEAYESIIYGRTSVYQNCLLYCSNSPVYSCDLTDHS